MFAGKACSLWHSQLTKVFMIISSTNGNIHFFKLNEYLKHKTHIDAIDVHKSFFASQSQVSSPGQVTSLFAFTCKQHNKQNKLITFCDSIVYEVIDR